MYKSECWERASHIWSINLNSLRPFSPSLHTHRGPTPTNQDFPFISPFDSLSLQESRNKMEESSHNHVRSNLSTSFALGYYCTWLKVLPPLSHGDQDFQPMPIVTQKFYFPKATFHLASTPPFLGTKPNVRVTQYLSLQKHSSLFRSRLRPALEQMIYIYSTEYPASPSPV